jgi:hypothetical protein
MDTPLRSITDAAVWRTANTSEMHNASVDEDAARAGECGQVHLPTGRMCTLPHGHARSCEFISAEAAAASLAHRGPMTAGNRPDRGGGVGACERPTESSNPTVVRTGRVRQKVDAVTTDRPHRARVHPSRRADPPPCNDPSNYLG